jgi:hypothetical protein
LFSGFALPELRPGSPAESAAQAPAPDSAAHIAEVIKKVRLLMSLFIILILIKSEQTERV